MPWSSADSSARRRPRARQSPSLVEDMFSLALTMCRYFRKSAVSSALSLRASKLSRDCSLRKTAVASLQSAATAILMRPKVVDSPRGFWQPQLLPGILGSTGGAPLQSLVGNL